MRLPTRLHRAVWVVLFTVLSFLGVLSAAPKPTPQTWGEVVSGLQMTIYLDETGNVQLKAPKFRVELLNAGENDLILNLGIMLANGRRQYPNAVHLTVTDAQGKSRQLLLREPSGIAGRVDPLIVPLPVGATFSVPVDFDKYLVAPGPQESEYKLKPGTYSLEAQFTGRGVSQQEANLDVKGIALMPYWTGTVTSNELRFEIPN